MIQSAPDFDSARDEKRESATPVAAAMMTVTFALAALSGAAFAGLMSLFGG